MKRPQSLNALDGGTSGAGNYGSAQAALAQNSQNQDGSTRLVKPKQLQASSSKTEGGGIGRMGLIRKKKEKLQALLRPRSRTLKSRLPKTIEFGYEFTTSYNRHTSGGGPVKKIFYNKNTRTFVSYNEKQLHVWREDNGEQVLNVNFFDETGSHQISCMVYSSKHMFYLAISTDFKLHIFNELLIRVGWMPLNVRLIYFAYFYEEESTLITGGIDGCFMFKFNAETKYDPRQGVMLDPEGHSFQAQLGPKIKIEKMPLWIKGLKVSVKQNMIFSWSQLKVCFNDLDGKILFRYKKLTSYEDHITDIFVSEKYRYFVTSTFSGQIIVWKLKKRKELIHAFNNSHTKCVTSLQEIPNQPTLFISASNDNTVRIFSLDKFTELYSFILPAGVTQINLLSERVFACFYNNQIKIGILHHLALSFYNSKIEVKKIIKMFKCASDRMQNKCDAIMTLFTDNSVQIQNSDWQDPYMKSTIFPPPGAKEVMFCGYTMLIDRIILVLVDGTICVYMIDQDGDASILERIIESKSIKDRHNRNLNQNITSVTLADTIPPNFDFETFSENTVGDQRQLEQTYQQEIANKDPESMDRYLVLGLSKGAVVFLSVTQLDRIYARFFFHRSAIVKVVEIPQREKFITICAEMNISVWGFKDLRSHILSLNQMYRPVDELVTMNDMVLMLFKSGEAQLFKFDSDLNDLVFIKTETSFDHDKQVHHVETFPKYNLFITGSVDGYAKVWNVKKELIREIKFPEKVFSVCFLNPNADILVGHHGKVSMVSCKDYNPFEVAKSFKPSDEDLEQYYKRKAKLADDELYLGLKKRDDDIKKQNQLMRTSVQPEGVPADNTQASEAEVKTTNINRREQRQKSLETEKKHAILEERKKELREKKRARSKEKGSLDEHNRTKSLSEMEDDYTDSDMDSEEEWEAENLAAQQNQMQLFDKGKKDGDNIKTETLQAQRPSNNSLKTTINHQGSQLATLDKGQPASQSRSTSIPIKLPIQASKYLGQSIPKRSRHPEGKSPTKQELQQSRLAQLTQPLNMSSPQLVSSVPFSVASQSNVMPSSGAKNTNSIKDMNNLLKAQNRGNGSMLHSSRSPMKSRQNDNDFQRNQGLQKQSNRPDAVYSTTAIPREVTNAAYQNAITMQIHQKNKKTYFTRRDLTLERIQDNVIEHNDPSGQNNEFSSILIGQRSQMDISSVGTHQTPQNNNLLFKGKNSKDQSIQVKNKLINNQGVENQQNQTFGTRILMAQQKSDTYQSTKVIKNNDSVGMHQQSRDSIIRDSGSDAKFENVIDNNNTLDSNEQNHMISNLKKQKDNGYQSTTNSVQKQSINSITVKELAKKHVSDDHYDSLFQTPDASIMQAPPLLHQSNQNSLSQKNLEILEKSHPGLKGKRLNAHYQSTSELERLADDKQLNSSIGKVDLLRKNNRYNVQPLHLYAEQMRHYSDLGGKFYSRALDQKQDSILEDVREPSKNSRTIGPLEKIKHSVSQATLLESRKQSHLQPPPPPFILPSVHHHPKTHSSIGQAEITVNVEGDGMVAAGKAPSASVESDYQIYKKRQYAQRKKHLALKKEAEMQRKLGKGMLSNQDIEQILKNQDKKVYMNNVPIKSNLVPKRPPVEFLMPNSYQSTNGMQAYKPLGGSLERGSHKLNSQKLKEFKKDDYDLIKGQSQQPYDYLLAQNSAQTSIRITSNSDEDYINQPNIYKINQSASRMPKIKGLDMSGNNITMKQRTSSMMQQEVATATDNSKFNYDQLRTGANSQLESIEWPYYSNVKDSGLNSAINSHNQHERFSLERLSKNDPLATLDAMRRYDYQLVKAQELSILKNSPHMPPEPLLSKDNKSLSIQGISHRPLQKSNMMDEGLHFPQIGSSHQYIGEGIQTSLANKHLNIQDSYDITHPGAFQHHAGSTSAATSATHQHQVHQFHSQPAFKPSLQTLRATEKQKEQIKRAAGV